MTVLKSEKDYNPDGVAKLAVAVIRQWRDDGKPKAGEAMVKQYASLLRQANLIKTVEFYRTVTLPASVSRAIGQMEAEAIWRQ